MTNPNLINIVFIVGLVALFYFFTLRPQQQKQKKQKAFIDGLKKGDNVITLGGLHGKIAEIEGNTVLLEIEKGVKVRFEKNFLSFENSAILAKK